MNRRFLYTLLALVLMVGLAVPMATQVAATNGPTTTTVDPEWQKTTNSVLEYKIGNDTDYRCDDAYWSWTAADNTLVWTGANDTDVSGNPISPELPDYYWANWTSPGAWFGNFTHRWFKTTIEIDCVAGLQQVILVNKFPEGTADFLEINDDLYVYVNGVYAASGGTANVAAIQAVWEANFPYSSSPYANYAAMMAALPADFVTATMGAKAKATAWYFDGGLTLPVSLFQNGTNTICILTEDFAGRNDTNGLHEGGMGHVVFRITSEPCLLPEIELTKSGPDSANETETITYFYTANNTGSISIWKGNITIEDTLGIPVNPVLESDGNVTGDEDKNGYLDPGEKWVYEGNYTVPCFTLGPIYNTGNITVEYDGSSAWFLSNQVEVPILHEPDITVTKVGPGVKTGPRAPGFYDHVHATYTYTVTNTGNDCLEDVYLVDSMIGPIGSVGTLSPGQQATFWEDYLLECTGVDKTVFTNVALVNGTDVTPELVWDYDCWSVVVFQWLPRTIGYWGNWDNHMNSGNISALLGNVTEQSAYFDEEVDTPDWDELHDFLLDPVKGKMNAGKAEQLLQKQLLATWLNVKSYEAFIAGYDFGALDQAIDPDAMVYFDTGGSMTVMQLLHRIENAIPSMSVDGLLKAKDILDMINNAEHNGYYMFMDPAFDPGLCMIR